MRFHYDSRLAFLLTLYALSIHAQEPLRQQIRAIAAEAHGKVSVACSLPGSTLNCNLDPNAHPPMQSVFKLPLGITVLHQVEQHTFSLDQPVRFLPQDRIPHAYSPLQDQYPNAAVDVPLRELLRLAVSLSDNVAADILLRLVGGPEVVNTYIAGLGVSGFHLQDNEAALHHDVPAQYRNWFEPLGAVQLLRTISDQSPLTPEHTELLLGWMTPAARTKRLEGNLPGGTRVAHKSGTSDVDNGLAHATNDIGLIPLPDGRRIAIAVFVTDSTADQDTRELVIARIARAVYDASQSAPPAYDKAIFQKPIPADQLTFLKQFAGAPAKELLHDKRYRKIVKDAIPNCTFHYGSDMSLSGALDMVLGISKLPVEIREGRYLTVSGTNGPYLAGRGFIWIDLQEGIVVGGFYFHPTNGEPTPALNIFSKQIFNQDYLLMSQLPPAFADDLIQWATASRVSPVTARYFITGSNKKILLLHNEDYCVFADGTVAPPGSGCQQLGVEAADIDMDCAIDVSLNGIDNNTFANAGSIGRNGIAMVPSVDAVQEFKVKTNNFAAEYGHAPARS